MDLLEGVRLIERAYERQKEEQAFKLYTAKYAYMSKENFIPFSEFYNPERPIDSNQTVQEILTDVKEIIDDFRR